LVGAVGRYIVVWGVGLLLLTINFRRAGVIYRSRLLYRELRDHPSSERESVVAQMRMLNDRARMIQRAITLAAVSVLLAAVLVIVLFLTAFFRWEDPWLIALLFIGCMLSLIGSLLMFIRDLNRSLIALQLEVGHLKGSG
jgi:hypothetical protein